MVGKCSEQSRISHALEWTFHSFLHVFTHCVLHRKDCSTYWSGPFRLFAVTPDPRSIGVFCILRVVRRIEVDISCDLGLSRFVAGAVFGDLGLLLFVAVKLDRPLTFLLWHWSLLMKRGTRKKTESRLSQCLLLSTFSPIFCKLGWAWNRRRVGTWCASGRGVYPCVSVSKQAS